MSYDEQTREAEYYKNPAVERIALWFVISVLIVFLGWGGNWILHTTAADRPQARCEQSGGVWDIVGFQPGSGAQIHGCRD